MTDDLQPQNKGSPLDIGGELADLESNLRMDQSLMVMFSRPMKRALGMLAVRRQTNVSTIIRHALMSTLRQEYPEFDGMYHQALKEELETRKKRNV